MANNTVLFGMQGCNFTRLVAFPSAYVSALPLVAGDFNGDGAPDLVFASWDGSATCPAMVRATSALSSNLGISMAIFARSPTLRPRSRETSMATAA